MDDSYEKSDALKLLFLKKKAKPNQFAVSYPSYLCLKHKGWQWKHVISLLSGIQAESQHIQQTGRDACVSAYHGDQSSCCQFKLGRNFSY